MDRRTFLAGLALVCLRASAQTPCATVPEYSPCDFVFELAAGDAAAHPNPYLTVELSAEFRSPRHRTFLAPAFWDGGTKVVIRFTPTEAGAWDYRLTSNIAAWNGKTGNFTATENDSPGFIRAANVHHWAYTERNIPHLWMGATELRFAFLEDAAFRALVDARAEQKFNHIRGLVIGGPQDSARAFPSPDRPDPAWFQRLDERIRYINGKGMVADLILGGPRNHLTTLFPTWEQRQRYVRYVLSRYAPMNVTWQAVDDFESYDKGRDVTKEIGTLLKEADPYGHPRTSGTSSSSSPLLDDHWMDFVAQSSSADDLGAIEHQLYATPFVNLNFGVEGAIDADTVRRRLWNSTMDGQYPTYASTGTNPQTPGARQMSAWYEFFAGTRHWELEPYFDVDGGRAVALEGVEYIVYVEKPGPVELLVEKHGYDVAWINPATGERTKMKDYKGEHFTGEPPDRSHDWVLHVSREGRKEGMLRSYKFESRRIDLQEIDSDPRKVPYAIEQPAGDLSLSKPAQYAAKIRRETRATRSMLYLWTAESPGGQGFRVVGTGAQGTLRLPPNIAASYPAVLNLRLFGMNANGKVYAAYQTYNLNR